MNSIVHMHERFWIFVNMSMDFFISHLSFLTGFILILFFWRSEWKSWYKRTCPRV